MSKKSTSSSEESGEFLSVEREGIGMGLSSGVMLGVFILGLIILSAIAYAWF